MAESDEKKVHRIDGSRLEGGGQILRMSTGFSALLGLPLEIYNIRGGRAKPGLKRQHLHGISLIKDMARGELVGDQLDSQRIEFSPGGRPTGGKFRAEASTAASVTLMAQAALPCLLLGSGSGELDLKGGTHVDFAPTSHYYQEVFFPTLKKFGACVELATHRYGFFPRGGGHATISVKSTVSKFKPVELLEQGLIHGTETGVQVLIVLGSGVHPKRGEDVFRATKSLIRSELDGLAANSQIIHPDFKAKGKRGDDVISCLVYAVTSTGMILASSALSGKKKSDEMIAAEAARGFVDLVKSGACLDSNLQDQVIMYMALADGVSRVRVGELTLHTKTAIDISEKFTDAKFTVTAADDGKTNVIECKGTGLSLFEHP